MKFKDLFWELPDMQLFLEDFAIDPNITLPEFDPRYSKVVGTMDGKEVWGSRFFGVDYMVFAFRDDVTLLAFIIISTEQYKNCHRLTRIWVNPETQGKGYATSLVQFVRKKLNIALIITSDEPLTNDGWKWLIKAVDTHRIKAVDASGTEIVADQLRNEFNNQVPTKTEIFIERAILSVSERLFATGYRTLNEMVRYIGDENLD